MKFEPISFASLYGTLEAEFKFTGFSEATKVSLIAEHIRGIVDIASIFDGEDGPTEVSHQKLAMEIRRRVAPLIKDLNQGPHGVSIINEIDAMERLHEIWKSPTGGYSVSPPRLLPIDETSSLLIGGGAGRVLPRAIRKNLEQAGRARILTRSSSLAAELECVAEQTMQSWLGLSREDALSWSKDFLDSIKLTGPLDDEAENLLVLSGRRWVPATRCAGPFGRRLARREVSIFGNQSFHYYVCALKASSESIAVVDSVARIERQQARRLQPYMSSGEGSRPTMQCEVIGTSIRLALSWPLPEPEDKILYLGWTHPIPEGEASWPKYYDFSAKLYPFLAKAFDVLGYSLTANTK